MMTEFKIGDRVRATPPSYSSAESGLGTVTDVSPISVGPWFATVRLDNGVEDVYAFAELEHVEGDEVKKSVLATDLEEKVALFEKAIRRAAKGDYSDTSDTADGFSVEDRDTYTYDELEHVEDSGHIDSLDEYQHRTRDTAVYPGQGMFGGALYAAMALNEEAGEVAGKVAKFIRKGSGWDELLAYGAADDDAFIEDYPDELVLAVSKELGDVLYQAARVADEFGLNLSDVATENIDRLADRMARNVIIGEGDNR